MRIYYDAGAPISANSRFALISELPLETHLLIISEYGELAISTTLRQRHAVALDSAADLSCHSRSCVLYLNVEQFKELCDCNQLQCLATKDTSYLMPVVKRIAAPCYAKRDDGEVVCFACSGDRWMLSRDCAADTQVSRSLYYLCLNALACPMTFHLEVVQLPLQKERQSFRLVSGKGVSSITAHRGLLGYLETCLSSLSSQDGDCIEEMMVGLDVEDVSDYRPLAARYSQSVWWQPNAPPVGPYVLRQYLAERSCGEYLLWQDSDDVSCSNRVKESLGCLSAYGSQMVGCHAIEVNEVAETVRAVRYPLDVTAVLADNSRDSACAHANEPLLHATAMVVKSRFLEVGGFSINRIIASDSQFLLRAHFGMTIRNVDEFLYVRRVHKSALTFAAATRIGSNFRLQLGRKWNDDFRAVKKGRMLLHESSLVSETSDEEHMIHALTRELWPSCE